MMTEEEYVKKQGLYCPNCESYEITGGSLNVYAELCYQNITCSVCGASWMDVYELTGYTEYEAPEGGNNG